MLLSVTLSNRRGEVRENLVRLGYRRVAMSNQLNGAYFSLLVRCLIKRQITWLELGQCHHLVRQPLERCHYMVRGPLVRCHPVEWGRVRRLVYAARQMSPVTRRSVLGPAIIYNFQLVSKHWRYEQSTVVQSTCNLLTPSSAGLELTWIKEWLWFFKTMIMMGRKASTNDG